MPESLLYHDLSVLQIAVTFIHGLGLYAKPPENELDDIALSAYVSYLLILTGDTQLSKAGRMPWTCSSGSRAAGRCEIPPDPWGPLRG